MGEGVALRNSRNNALLLNAVYDCFVEAVVAGMEETFDSA